jgi:hypothetical protein
VLLVGSWLLDVDGSTIVLVNVLTLDRIEPAKKKLVVVKELILKKVKPWLFCFYCKFSLGYF